MALLQKPVNTAIVNTAFTEIKLPAGQGARDYAVQSRGANDMYISDTLTGTKYWTVKSGTAHSFSDVKAPKGGVICYAKSAAANDTLELIAVK